MLFRSLLMLPKPKTRKPPPSHVALGEVFNLKTRPIHKPEYLPTLVLGSLLLANNTTTYHPNKPYSND